MIVFNFFLKAFLYSRVVSSKWTFRKIARFCKIQLSQNVEARFWFVIRNFSTNIISKSKKSLIFNQLIRILRVSHLITQDSIQFLNDDYFKTWKISWICFFIWSSTFLYLTIKSCKIFLIKDDIIFEKIYIFANVLIVSFILIIFWVIFDICFFDRRYFFIIVL